jgi:shikimate dehydrogenase
MRRFGLIGYPLSHSFSQKYFTEKFQRENLTGCTYENFPIASVEELRDVLQSHPDLEGLNVTIPYKEKVIPMLSWQHEVVQATGACNCIKIVNNKLCGYNTDVVGFEQSLAKQLQAVHRKALVLGTGGAAKAVQYVLQKRGIEYLTVSRQPQGGNQIDYAAVRNVLPEYLLVINTTPLGMYPAVEACPPLPYEQITPQHFLFDLIYNPPLTQFLQQGKNRGALIENGADMLVIQAEESWKIWNTPSVIG